MTQLKIPPAPNSIEKGVPLKLVLDKPAVNQLGENIKYVYEQFDTEGFKKESLKDIEPLSLTQRSEKIAHTLRNYLPENYSDALQILLDSLTPPLDKTSDNGLAGMFYMPHCHFIAAYGIDKKYNNNKDPFKISMRAQYELTQRFTCEFSIRPFIISQEERTLKVLYKWMKDRNPHVRRLCSEGTRPRLPWAMRLKSFVKDPSPVLQILEELKNDPELYVRRSVANHVGDIAKDNLEIALNLCRKWLNGADSELKWVIRHALRHPAKKGNSSAIELRRAAK